MISIICEDIMCTNPITVRESLTVGDVTHLLLRYRINGILVVSDDDPRKLVGIYTTTDSLRLLDKAFDSGSQKLEELKKISQIKVGEVCSRDVKSMKVSDKATKAIAMMHRENVHTIPVFDHDELVGVLGRHDLLNLALSSDAF